MDVSGRYTDPESSHVAVQAIAQWATLNDCIRAAANRLHPLPFDDTDLTILIAKMRGPVQRNVVARGRGLLEKDGEFVRVGLRERNNRKTVHFRLPEEGEEVIPHATYGYQRLSDLAYCDSHDRAWNLDSGSCPAAYDTQPCRAIDLFVRVERT